ncbi:MAG: hypothetical protein KAY46_03845 [Burkholderiaceae bacterium]|nr:hypothetical protein [Burkholderiaceae bacterium]
MKITGTGSILLDGRATGYVLVQHGTNTVVFHQRFGTALALPSAHYDLSGRPGSPHPGRHDFERDFRQALKASEGHVRR